MTKNIKLPTTNANHKWNTFDRASTTLNSSETLLDSWVTNVWISDIANSVAVSEKKCSVSILFIRI
jgi:hypothetical protein